MTLDFNLALLLTIDEQVNQDEVLCCLREGGQP